MGRFVHILVYSPYFSKNMYREKQSSEICPSRYILAILLEVYIEKNKRIKTRTYLLCRIHKQLGSFRKCNVLWCKYLPNMVHVLPKSAETFLIQFPTAK